MKSKVWVGFYLSLTLFLAACAGPSSPYLPAEQVPAGNSREIRVNKAFDFVYLNTFDAVNMMPNWIPEKTIKDEGLIQLKNKEYSRFDDSDRRVINLRIRRDSPTQTSVFLEQDSQRVIGADEVLAVIRKKLGVAA